MTKAITMAATLTFALASGCSPGAPEPAEPPGDDELKQMISRAASVDNNTFDTLAESGMISLRLEDLDNQPLTLALMLMRIAPPSEGAGKVTATR